MCADITQNYAINCCFFEESLMLCYQEVMLFKHRHLHSIEMIIEVYRYVTSPEAVSPDCLVAWFCRVCTSKFILSQPNLKSLWPNLI